MTTQRLHPEGLIGKKLGMTQVFTPEGECVPVTAIQVGPCYVLQVKNKAKDGYSGVQLGFEPKKSQRTRKSEAGHFNKAGKGAFSCVKEVRCDVEGLGWVNPGQELKVTDVFKDGEFVDVSGTSVGKGFQGVVKRWNAKGQPMTRGTHEMQRNIGSIGCRKFPGRVFKGKHMPGLMGNANVTIQNLKVISVRPEENILLVRGGVPGHVGGIVVIRKAMKSYSPKKAA